MSRRHETPPADVVSKGYDPRDVPARSVAYVGIGLFAGIIVSGAIVAGLLAQFDRLARPEPTTALEAADLVPPGPRLETAPAEDRIAVESRAKNRLQGYAWLDRQAGTVRIPVERAMELLAARGWPDEEEQGR